MNQIGGRQIESQTVASNPIKHLYWTILQATSHQKSYSSQH